MISSGFGFSQTISDLDWISRLNDPDANFEQTVELANSYFEFVGTGKGTGWKTFKRWEYWAGRHVGADGTLREWFESQDRLKKYLLEYPEMDISNQRRNSPNGAWSQLGPVNLPSNGTGQPNGLGRTSCITFHPTNPSTIYVGTPAGGFWSSTDYGVSWIESSIGLTRLGVSSIVVDPSTPNIIYAGTGDRDGGDTPGYGVWRSIDGGVSWAPRNTTMGNRPTYEILMHPADPNTLICSTPGRIWRSTNAGTNWTSTYSGAENFKDIAFKPGDPNIVYAASNDFYRSTDNGQTWLQITSGLPTGISRFAIATTTADPNLVYLIAGSSTSFVGFYRSTDSGLNFSTRSTTPNILGYDVTGGTGSQAWYDLVALGDPNNANHITIGGINLWESNDGGTSWTIVSHWVGSGGNPPVHADQHELEYSPHTGHLWNGNDGGVYYSTDAGNTWPELSNGLAIAQVYKIGQSQQTKDLVINGYQDNGTAIYRGASGWWTEIGGDGMECIIDYSDENYMYGSLYYGDIRRSTNNGISFGNITSSISETGGWVTPFTLHPTDPNTMLVGMKNMWRSTNVKAATPSFTQISALPGTSNITDIAISPSDPNIVYISRAGSSNFFRSNNAMGASPTWTDLDASLPTTGQPMDIEIDPTDPTHVWIALGTNIYESVNSGTSWTDISTNLPSLTAHTIVYDKRSTNDALYIGMDVGVYYKDNSSTNWIPFSAGLPNVEISELEIYYDPECAGNDMLRAGTYGRGLWESDLRDPGNVPPIACFTANPTTPCVGEAVILSDNSAYSPTSWNWSISPATFSFVNSTTNSSQNPQVQFNAIGTYTITLTSTNGSGSDLTTRTNYVTVVGASLTLPVTEDFETAALCATTSNCGTTTCALPNNWVNEPNGTVDFQDWRINEGSTPSANTGPVQDFSPGTITGNYAYLEASACSNSEAQMISPCIDLRTAINPELSFAYHMFGANMGELHVDVLSGGAWNLDVTPFLIGDQGNNWFVRTVSLSPFIGNVIKIRFRGITGNGFASDMALDAIGISEQSILATNLLKIDGYYIPKAGNNIIWEASNIENLENWRIEKQLDNGQYEEIGLVGSMANKLKYDFLDREPNNGWNRYRLRSIDKNGQIFDAGNVEVLSTWEGESLNLYPNPSNGQFNLRIQAQNSEIVQIEIHDLLGKLVYSEMIKVEGGIQNHPLELSNIDAGIYFLRYKDHTIKLIKN